LLYLTISEGDDPDRAQPILGTTDADLIRGVADLLRRRLGGGARDAVEHLHGVGRRQRTPGNPPEGAAP
jgi:hypothetical protein